MEISPQVYEVDCEGVQALVSIVEDWNGGLRQLVVESVAVQLVDDDIEMTLSAKFKLEEKIFEIVDQRLKNGQFHNDIV